MIREFVGSCFQQITELLLEDEVKLTIGPQRYIALGDSNPITDSGPRIKS